MELQDNCVQYRGTWKELSDEAADNDALGEELQIREAINLFALSEHQSKSIFYVWDANDVQNFGGMLSMQEIHVWSRDTTTEGRTVLHWATDEDLLGRETLTLLKTGLALQWIPNLRLALEASFDTCSSQNDP